MKNVLRFLSAIVLFLGIAVSANATVLTFDDITDAVSCEISVPDNYGGFNWTGIKVRHQDLMTSDSGYDNATISENYVAYNAWEKVATINNAIFDFNGVYLSAAWNNDLVIQVDGWNNGTVTYSKTVTVSTSGAQWFSFDFLNIDALTFTSFGGTVAGFCAGSGTHFAMDNFTFNEPVQNNQPAPEPSTIILFGVVLLGFGAIGLRNKNKHRNSDKE